MVLTGHTNILTHSVLYNTVAGDSLTNHCSDGVSPYKTSGDDVAIGFDVMMKPFRK